MVTGLILAVISQFCSAAIVSEHVLEFIACPASSATRIGIWLL